MSEPTFTLYLCVIRHCRDRYKTDDLFFFSPPLSNLPGIMKEPFLSFFNLSYFELKKKKKKNRDYIIAMVLSYRVERADAPVAYTCCIIKKRTNLELESARIGLRLTTGDQKSSWNAQEGRNAVFLAYLLRYTRSTVQHAFVVSVRHIYTLLAPCNKNIPVT